MIKRCCARLGTARKLAAGSDKESFFWLIGACMFSHLVGFFGINYFDQSRLNWFMLLAMIAAVTASSLGQQEADLPVTFKKPETDSVWWQVPETVATSWSHRWSN